MKNSPQKILVTGATGFVGKAVVSFLNEQGHAVTALRRSKTAKKQPGTIYWNPDQGEYNLQEFEGFDAVIHLAGEGIASCIWTKEKKASIRKSRVHDTHLLSQILVKLKKPPKTFLCASAVGFYGSRGNEMLTEESSAGKGFLAETCVQWEEACSSVKDRGMRLVNMRFGNILAQNGGMLQKLLPAYKCGLGTVLGKETQIVSWIALEDVVGALYHCLKKEEICGPVNFVSPFPVLQAEFVKTLAEKVHRPAFLRIPRWVVRLVAGEMGQELFLTSLLAYPEVLVQTGYSFRCPCLKLLSL